MTWKNQYMLIAALKKVDICLQVLCFIFMVITMVATFYYGYGYGGIGILAMAGFQVLSALFWLFTLYKEPYKTPAGMFIRGMFVIVPLLLVLIYTSGREGSLLLITAYAMLVIGPVLGFSYFFITICEMRYYKKLARGRG